MSRSRLIVRWSLGLVVLLSVLALVAPRNLGAGQAVMLRRFLGAMGVTVTQSDAPAGGDATFLLLTDVRTQAQDAALLDWAKSGGRLVLADPGSLLLQQLAEPRAQIGVFGQSTLQADCVRVPLAAGGSIEVDAGDLRLQPSDAGASACFANGDGAYALFIPEGSGEVVLLGGGSVFSDQLLNQGQNANFAYGLLGQGSGLVIGSPYPANSPRQGLVASLPSGARVLILQLIVATFLFMLARGRRLGRPIPEEPISPIPSGELVMATAGLYRRAKALGFCASILRRAAARRLAGRLGLPAGTAPADLPTLIARNAGSDAESVRLVLDGPDPANDAELVALANELDDLTQRLAK